MSPDTYRVRIGMGAKEAEVLNDLLLRCPEDVRQAICDQLWLRALFTTYLKKMAYGERPLFEARADRLLEQLDPRDP